QAVSFFTGWKQGAYPPSLFAQYRKPCCPGFVELGFQPLPYLLCQGRALSIGRDSDLQIAALHHGWRVEVAMWRIINGIAQDTCTTAFVRHRAVDCRKTSRRIYQPIAACISWLEDPRLPLKQTALCPLGDMTLCLWRDHAHFRAGV